MFLAHFMMVVLGMLPFLCSAFNVGDLVITKKLPPTDEVLNRRPAVVMGAVQVDEQASSCYPVLVWTGLYPSSSFLGSSISCIKEANLLLYDPVGNPDEMPPTKADSDLYSDMKQKYPDSWEHRKIPLEKMERYRDYARLIVTLSAGDVGALFEGEKYRKLRLIGAALYEEGETFAMVEVINDFLPRPYKRSVESLWNRIGDFLG